MKREGGKKPWACIDETVPSVFVVEVLEHKRWDQPPCTVQFVLYFIILCNYALHCNYTVNIHVTETVLIKKLTKINRMDIVHLIETKIIKSSTESSHTYAEIEHTISLDHSEGK